MSDQETEGERRHRTGLRRIGIDYIVYGQLDDDDHRLNDEDGDVQLLLTELAVSQSDVGEWVYRLLERVYDQGWKQGRDDLFRRLS